MLLKYEFSRTALLHSRDDGVGNENFDEIFTFMNVSRFPFSSFSLNGG